MQLHPAVLLPLERLLPNPDNPKRAIGAKYLRGLREALATYGFCGTLQVGNNLDGTATVLDGNTRLEELQRANIAEVWCQFVPVCEEGAEGWREARKAFAIAHDRNRKIFNEDEVLRQLKDLASKGQDIDKLAKLTAQDNLPRLLDESKKAQAALSGNKAVLPKQATWVLYGNAEDIEASQQLVKRIRGRFEAVFKLRATLEQAEQFADLKDATFATLFLASLSRLQVE